jgi:hypothetical protein
MKGTTVVALLGLLVVAAVVVVHGASTKGGEKKKVSVDAPPSKDNLTRHHGRVPPGAHGRSKRAATCGTQTKMHATEASQSVFSHNLFRSREVASNLLAMTWSDEMAAVSQAWADTCTWGHGMLYDCSGLRIGQNLFVEASSGGFPALNVTKVAEAWDNERLFWDFASGTCKAPVGKSCGHWSQLVAARSNEVGCGYAQCATMNVGGEIWNNALFVVCDYNPPGNAVGVPVFLAGTPCSNCDSDNTGAGYKCVSNQCVKCSPSTDSTCKCGNPQTCQNGGVWTTSTCTCTCAAGFYGTNCEHHCSCADVTPLDCPYWIDFCTNPDYSDFMTENCKTTCNFPCSLPASCSA